MEDLSEVLIAPMPDSPYVKPLRLTYVQNKQKKTWDLLEVHDSVAIVLFNVTRRRLIFVKQFRPAVYFNSLSPEHRALGKVDISKYPASLGITLELCAGIVDKDLPLKRIACEEVHEECGYMATPDNMEHIMTYRSGVGTQGSMQTLFYCEVNDDMKVAEGGGVDGEIIEVVEKKINEVEDMLAGPGPLPTPPSALYALSWFLLHKADRWRKEVSEAGPAM